MRSCKYCGCYLPERWVGCPACGRSDRSDDQPTLIYRSDYDVYNCVLHCDGKAWGYSVNAKDLDEAKTRFHEIISDMAQYETFIK